MKPATKVIAILLFGLLGFVTLDAQEKDKPNTTVTLDKSKIAERLKQIENAITKRQKELLEADPQWMNLIGQYNGLAMSQDSTLMVKDLVKKAIN